MCTRSHAGLLATKARMWTHGLQTYRIIGLFSQSIRLLCLALPKALTASTNFWKKLMIEDRGQKGSRGFKGSPIDIWNHPMDQGFD